MKDQRRLLIDCINGDIPAVVFQGDDKCTLEILAAAKKIYKKNGCGEEFLFDWDLLLNEVKMYQAEFPDKVKLPKLSKSEKELIRGDMIKKILSKVIQIKMGDTVLEVATENYHEGEKKRFTFKEAKALELPDGWRVPTEQELNEIKKQIKIEDEQAYLYDSFQDKKTNLPFCGSDDLPDDNEGYYWSSTLSCSGAYYLHLTIDECYMCDLWLSQGYSVRCVRTVKE